MPMLATRLTLALLLVGPAATGALARSKGPTLRDRQQAACYGDVQRLCSEAMPNADKVTACMKPKKSLVSAKCRALWDVE